MIYGVYLIILVSPLWQTLLFYLNKYYLKNSSIILSTYLLAFITTSLYALYYIFTNLNTVDSITVESLVLNNALWSYLFLCFNLKIEPKFKKNFFVLKFWLPLLFFIVLSSTYSIKNFIYEQKSVSSEFTFNTFLIFTSVYFILFLVPIFLIVKSNKIKKVQP
jgi:hypothetical protein